YGGSRYAEEGPGPSPRLSEPYNGDFGRNTWYYKSPGKDIGPALQTQSCYLSGNLDRKPQRHKGHKDQKRILCVLCVFVVLFTRAPGSSLLYRPNLQLLLSIR